MQDQATEKVKLDQIIKSLFSTSKKVLIKLLNGIFDEDYNEDEVELIVTNNEFILEDYDELIGDMFFQVNKRNNYHIEFQTKNDNSMIIRMFKYGFEKAKEIDRVSNNNINTIYYPKQKVMFIEENKNIDDVIKLNIIFPNGKEIVYSVEVIKYWEYNKERLIKDKMYPLIPLQLFLLRKEIDKLYKNNDIEKINKICVKSKKLAENLAKECKGLFDAEEIIGEDLHRMLLAIDNLIEYLNKKYFKDKHIEEEIKVMTKTLYDPLVEERGIQKGIQKGEKIARTKMLLELLDMKIGKVPEVYKQKIEASDEEIITNIKLHLFDIKSIEELGRLLN